MKTVDVFSRVDGFEDAFGIYLRRERKLNENAVDVVVTIQAIDDGEEIFGADGSRRSEKPARQAELFARGNFAFYIELRSGAFADEDGGEPGTNACSDKGTNLVLQLGEDLVPDFQAIEKARGHEVSLSERRRNHNTAENGDWQATVIATYR